jgi:prepilin-type N-terminal cleavage/methylation domain-containing protein
MIHGLESISLMNKFRSKNGAEGFTLIEILVGMVIFAVAVLGLAAGTVAVIRSNQTSYLRTSAINLAQARLETLKAMNATAFSGVLTACPSFASPGCSDAPVSAGATFSRSWQITQNSPLAGVNQIDVRVTWTDYAGQTVTVSSSVPQ